MDSRLFDKRVRVEKYTNTAAVGYAETKEWTFLKWSWSNISFKGGGMTFFEEGKNAFSRVVLTLRYDVDITYDCRFLYDNQYYYVYHIEDVDRKKYMRITSTNWEEAVE